MDISDRTFQRDLSLSIYLSCSQITCTVPYVRIYHHVSSHFITGTARISQIFKGISFHLLMLVRARARARAGIANVGRYLSVTKGGQRIGFTNPWREREGNVSPSRWGTFQVLCVMRCDGRPAGPWE